MATLKFHSVVEDLHAKCTVGICHKGDSRVVSVTAGVNAKTSGARARISTVPVVVDVVVLDGYTRLLKIREYNTAGRCVPNFKAVYSDIGIRSLAGTTRTHDAILSSGATVDDRKIATAVIPECNWVGLRAMDVGDFQLFTPNAASLEEDTIARSETRFKTDNFCNRSPG
jgi:hypothetical protein